MKLDSSGNLGLGVTPNTWYLSPSVYGAMQFGSGSLFYGKTTASASNLDLSANSYLDASGAYRYLFSAETTKFTQSTGSYYWYSAVSGTAGNTFSFGDPKMTLNSSGNLLVGTTTSTAKLTVINTADANKQIVFSNNASYYGSVGHNAGTGLNEYRTEATGGHGFFIGTSATADMTLNSSGNLGIGTASPSALAANYTTVDIRGTTGGALRFGNATDSAYIYSDSNETNIATATNKRMIFSINAAEKMRLDTSGNLTVSNGNLIVGTAGKGIDFSVTASGSGTMTSELLADYEEGTFTPTLEYSVTSTPSYNLQIGRYTKIGRVVQIQIYLGWNENGSTGDLLFTGLPFTSITSTGRAIPTFFSFGLLLVTSSITGYVSSNATSILPMINDNTGTQVSATNTDNDQDVYMTVTYEAA